ncbi:MAG: hypothetical protein PHI39_10655 [Kiritimatiellae bacterium]|jgi:hypothetical protein|nr:hypothetical protein [Kiritimatiellia bacterium]
MKHYSKDPRQITTRFSSSCRTCGKTLPKGAQAYYFPATRQVFCLSCGETSYQQFLESAFDEEQYQYQYR